MRIATTAAAVAASWLAGSAAARTQPTPPRIASLVAVNYVLPRAAAVDADRRWLLPDVAGAYDPPRPPRRLRVHGRRIRWRLPLG